MWAPYFWLAGARGFTSGLANVRPDLSLALLACLRAGDYNGAMRLWATIKPFEDLRARWNNGNNVAVVKEALAQLGYCQRAVRPPLSGLSESEQAEVGAILAGWTNS
jgi:4-hydroxy-tetrahydrodipicolinate synthase